MYFQQSMHIIYDKFELGSTMYDGYAKIFFSVYIFFLLYEISWNFLRI